MNTNILQFIFLIIFSSLLFSCTDDNDVQINPLDGYTKLNEGYALGAKAKVELWGQKNFFMGYNKLIAVVYDSLNLKEKITDAHVHFLPLMTMKMNGMTSQHSAPVEDPAEEPVDDVFPGAIAFVMPSSDGGTWTLGVSVHNHKYDKEGVAKFNITVGNPATPVMNVFTATTPDQTKLVLSLLQPSAPKVGMNDIEFTIHLKETMMSWPASNDYTIEITPEMPSMGHGSPNNVNPVSSGNGHYKGKVNFTMTGEWRINVLVKKGGIPVSSGLYFDITL
jgi:hypothetical protein